MQDDMRAAAAQYYDANPTIPDDLAFYIPTVSPSFTSVASRNILLYQSLPTSIQYRHAMVRRRKDDICAGTVARGIVE
jgi:hypothetical protein